MAETAVISVHNALVQRLATSLWLAGDKVYDEGEVPRGSPLPYVVIAALGEQGLGASYFRRRGHHNAAQLRCWGKDKYDAMLTFKDAASLLDGYRLTLEGHTWKAGHLDYITDFPEPDPEIGGHTAVAEYHAGTLVGT